MAHKFLPVQNFPVNYEFNADPINFPINGLVFVGLMALVDPPRPSVPQAVAKCRSAGIKVRISVKKEKICVY